MRKALRITLLILPAVLVLSTAGFIVWGETPARPMPEAVSGLKSDELVHVEVGRWLVFTPVEVQPVTGLIIYPGGRVDYRAYAPAAQQIAAHDYLVIIVHMPLNLAVFNPGIAADVMAAYPEIDRWAVGGHSLGGAMAANFAYSHPGSVKGLVLWAAYPAGSNDLSNSGLRVASISGTRDGLTTPNKIEASRALLPSDTAWTVITGGNHAHFGWYGEQSGDNPAEISRDDQQAQIIAATLALLKSME